MRIFLSAIAIFCLFFTSATAQIPGMEAKHWYFGTGTDGLDFNGTPITATVIPAKLTNKLSGVGFEGMIVVNDPLTGALLFYSDGGSVVGSNHVTMNNGAGLMGHASGTQTVHCVPDPVVLGKFFLLTTTSWDNTGGALYSTVVDFTNSSFPLGTVPAATKNVLIENGNFCQGNIVVSKPGTTDNWWIGHIKNTFTFQVRPVTSAGVGAATTYTFPTLPIGTGEVTTMAFSGMTNKVAAGSSNGLSLLDFDPLTGVLSNPFVASAAGTFLGNFSPNGSKLYVGQFAAGAYRLHQYDLSNGVLTNMNTCCYAHDTKVAPNGKMYHIHTYYSATPIAVIDFPDLTAVGNACGYNASAGIVGTFNGESRRFPEFVTLPFVPLDGPAFRYLRATPQDGHVRLDWAVNALPDGSRFEVERGHDGVFQRIGQLSAQGEAAYHFEDAQPSPMANTYRILLIDANGAQTYSTIAVVAPDANSVAWQLSPNPCHGQLQVTLAQQKDAHVEVLDLLGRSLLRQMAPAGAATLDLDRLAPGSYLLRLTVDGQAMTRRFERIAD